MPNTDEGAEKWESKLSGWFGWAVLTRRRELGLTAVQLAARTEELGYPVSRVAITKIENNARSGKLVVAELLILAAALEMPPMLLLFPTYPHGRAELLPGRQAPVRDAATWVSGVDPLPSRVDPDGTIQLEPSNPGVDLVRAAARQRALEGFELTLIEAHANEELTSDIWKRQERKYREAVARVNFNIEQAAHALWGESGELLE